MFYLSTTSRPSISIHAPSRERPVPMARFFTSKHFNPRSLAGATDDHIRWSPVTGISIHAPSRERRHDIFTSHRYCSNFNPRSLAGATALGILLERMREYFNPRSLAGATSDGSPADDAQGISIHAPSRERRPGAPHSIVPLPFQSTLPRGSDLRSLHLLIRHLLFQSTLPRGSDVRSSSALILL